MAIKEVIRMGHPTLKKVAELLTQDEIKSSWFADLCQDLYDTMKEEGGIGIAAPQINVSKQVALIDLPEESTRYGKLQASGLITIINPKITILSDEVQTFYEGCLSVPGLRGKVTRPNSIQIDFINHNGIEETIIANEFLATVFQHEIDHLFGKLYVERMEDLSSLTFIEEFDQFHKKTDVPDIDE